MEEKINLVWFNIM